MVAAVIGDLYLGTYVEQSKMTFGDLLDRWLAHKARRGRKPKTIAWYADLVEPPQPAEGQKRALTVTQATKLLAAAVNAASQPEVYTLAVTTAMREGELLGLRWQDLEPPLVHVRQALKKAGRRPEFGPVKSKAGERTVYLLPQGLAALERVKVRQQAEKAVAGARYEGYDLIFAQPNGRPIDPHNLVQREFKRMLAIAGLPRDCHGDKKRGLALRQSPS